MNKIFIITLVFLSSFIYSQTYVDMYGQLGVSGRYLVDKNGNPVQLRGMSLFWSQWGSKYWNRDVIRWVKNDWRVNVIRAAMGVEEGGYLSAPNTHKNLVNTVVQTCIDEGIYVIIDWHDHNAPNHINEAKSFFAEMAQRWGSYPNVIYEIFNEPNEDYSWDRVKNYAIQVIQTIRQYDPDNVILVGTPRWCQDVDIASQSPLTGVTNVMYTLHFYAFSHKASYRQKAQTAINNGLPIFVSEWGTCEYTGDGSYNFAESDAWLSFLDTNKISWCNWSLNDKAESASALVPGASTSGGWSDSQLTQSGIYVRNKIRQNPAASGVVVYLVGMSSGSVVFNSTNVVANVTSGNPISKVEFYIDNQLKTQDTSSPYSYSWDTTQYSDGWHNVKVVAYDNSNVSASAQTSVFVYNAPINITIISPQNGSTIYGRAATISANVNKGYENTITKVEFYINTTRIATDTVAPYSTTLDTTKYSDGQYTIKVTAYDVRGRTSSQEVSVNIKNKDDPPQVSITTPKNNSTVGGSVSIQVSASDDRGIQKVEFYIDNERKYTDVGSPYSWTWDTSSYSIGPHTIKVIAYDTSGQTASSEITVYVSHDVQTDNPPSVTITSPQNGAAVSGQITIQISASDDKGISKVELYLNTTKLADLTSSPYTYNLNTTSYSNGTYNLKAVAYDTNNQTAEYQISITISNSTEPPPQQDSSPQVVINNPKNNDVVSNTLNLDLTLNDDKGISKVEVYLNNSLFATYTSPNLGRNVFNIDVSNFNNDVYILKVVVFDTINQSSSSQVNIQISNSSNGNNGGNNGETNISLSFSPSVVLEGEVFEKTEGIIGLKGSVIMNISVVSDTNISKLEVYLGDSLLDTYELDSKTLNVSYVFDTTKYKEGQNTLSVSVYDSNGNKTTKYYNIEIDNFKDVYLCTPNNDGVNDFVNFNINSSVEIYDIKGKLLLTLSDSPKIWDTYVNNKKVKPGVYIYKVKHENQTIATGKIVVNY